MKSLNLHACVSHVVYYKLKVIEVNGHACNTDEKFNTY